MGRRSGRSAIGCHWLTSPPPLRHAPIHKTGGVKKERVKNNRKKKFSEREDRGGRNCSNNVCKNAALLALILEPP